MSSALTRSGFSVSSTLFQAVSKLSNIIKLRCTVQVETTHKFMIVACFRARSKLSVIGIIIKFYKNRPQGVTISTSQSQLTEKFTLPAKALETVVVSKTVTRKEYLIRNVCERYYQNHPSFTVDYFAE